MTDDIKPHNGLTPAQAERLAVLAEELGEAVQAVGKILRFGYDSRCHGDAAKPSGREMLVTELGDVQWAIELLICSYDLNRWAVGEARHAKAAKSGKYLHHQAQAADVAECCGHTKQDHRRNLAGDRLLCDGCECVTKAGLP